jgi:5-methylcytosine-specific restriction endonuclease McrA
VNTKKCVLCNKIFNVYKYRFETQKCCGKSCALKLRLTGKKIPEDKLGPFKKTIIWNFKDEIIQMYNCGMSCIVISKKFLCSDTTIERFLKRYIKLRKGGKRKGTLSHKKGIPQLKTAGANNPRWKGGITSLNQKIRHCIEYKNWVRTIFERDNYTCLLCTKRGGNLEVDHYPNKFSMIMSQNMIKSYEEAQQCRELWDTNNGRTLCISCHNKTKSGNKM